MDKSAERIAQCAAATEIQRAWRGEIGDFFHVRDEAARTAWTDVLPREWSKSHGRLIGDPRVVWLPRVDQLMEMVCQPDDPAGIELCGDFMEWVFDPCRLSYLNSPPLQRRLDEWHRIRTLKSPEQVWLAFVVWEKYRKVWTGTAWAPVGEE